MSDTTEEKDACNCSANRPGAMFPKVHATDCPEFVRPFHPRFGRGPGRVPLPEGAFDLDKLDLDKLDLDKLDLDKLDEVVRRAEKQEENADLPKDNTLLEKAPDDITTFIERTLTDLFGPRPTGPDFNPEGTVVIPSVFGEFPTLEPKRKVINGTLVKGILSTAVSLLDQFADEEDIDGSIVAARDLVRLVLEEFNV